jgi:hypothetical protein
MIFQLDAYNPNPNKSGLIEFVEEEYGEDEAMNADDIAAHERLTKIKNISNIQVRYCSCNFFIYL